MIKKQTKLYDNYRDSSLLINSQNKLNAVNTEKALSNIGLKIAQATLGEQIQGLAGDPNRRGAKPWWQSGWKSEGEAIETLRGNPELIQYFNNQPGFPKDLFKK